MFSYPRPSRSPFPFVDPPSLWSPPPGAPPPPPNNRSVERDVQIVHSKRRRESVASTTSTSEANHREATEESSPSPWSRASAVDLDAAVASLAGVPPGSAGGAHGSTDAGSTPVVAKSVRTGPMLAEADVVVGTEPSNSSQQDADALLDCSTSSISTTTTTSSGSGSSATAAEGGPVPDGVSYQRNLAYPAAATSEPGPAMAPAYPATATATAASVGWPGAGATTAGRAQEHVARGVEVDAKADAGAPAGAPVPEPAPVSMEGKTSARQEDVDFAMDLGMGMTDADLLDISAVLMGEEGLLDDLA